MLGKKKEESVLESVKKIIADTLEIDVKEVKEESNLIADLGMESLDLVDLVFALEEEIGTEFEDEELLSIKTVKDLLNLIDEKTK